MAMRVQRAEFPAYSTVIAQGGFSQGIYFIEKGTILLRRAKPKGSPKGGTQALEVARIAEFTGFGEAKS